MDGWNISFLLGYPIFRCYLSSLEGIQFLRCTWHLGAPIPSRTSLGLRADGPARWKMFDLHPNFQGEDRCWWLAGSCFLKEWPFFEIWLSYMSDILSSGSSSICLTMILRFKHFDIIFFHKGLWGAWVLDDNSWSCWNFTILPPKPYCIPLVYSDS